MQIIIGVVIGVGIVAFIAGIIDAPSWAIELTIGYGLIKFGSIIAKAIAEHEETTKTTQKDVR